MDIDMVYRAMLRQELSRPDYSRKYEYLKYRRILVDWMSEVGEEMQVRKETVHTAIAYLERVLAVRALTPPFAPAPASVHPYSLVLHPSIHPCTTDGPLASKRPVPAPRTELHPDCV